MDHDFPVRFDQAIRRLAPSRAGYDGGTFQMQERPNVAAEKSLVAITSELTGEISGLSAKGKKRQQDIVVMQRFEPKAPIETSRTIHKDESIFTTSDRHTVSERDINMDYVEIFRKGTVERLASRSFRDSRVGSNGNRKLSIVQKLSILGCVNKMSIIAELAAPCQSVKLLSGEVMFSIQSVGGITGANRRRRFVRVM